MMFKNKGFKIGNILYLTPRDAFAICNEDAIMLDVREDFMIGYKKFAVKEVLYCSASTIKYYYQNLPDNIPLVIADATSLHSKETANFLFEKGFTNISVLAGGLVEWDRDGLPLQSNTSEMLTGSCMCQLKQRGKNK